MSTELEIRLKRDRKREEELRRRAEEAARRERERREAELAAARVRAQETADQIEASLRAVDATLAANARRALAELRAAIPGFANPLALGPLTAAARKETAMALAATQQRIPALMQEAHEALAFLTACEEAGVEIPEEKRAVRQSLIGFLKNPISGTAGEREAQVREARSQSLTLALEMRLAGVATTFATLATETWPEELRAWDAGLPERVAAASAALARGACLGLGTVVADVEAFFHAWAQAQIERLITSARAAGFAADQPRYDHATRTYRTEMRDPNGVVSNVCQVVPRAGEAFVGGGLYSNGPGNWQPHDCTAHHLEAATRSLREEGVCVEIFDDHRRAVLLCDPAPEAEGRECAPGPESQPRAVKLRQ